MNHLPQKQKRKNFATMIKIGMSPLDLELSTSGPISAELGVGTKLILYIGIVLAFALLITFFDIVYKTFWFTDFV